MCLYYGVKHLTRLSYNAISHVRSKIHKTKMSDLNSERKFYICSKPEKYDYIEDVVCKDSDIKENEMKLLPLGDAGEKILLIKQKGELHAIGTKCTHYGALLHTGALGDGRVRCPWHGACFNIKTGDIEDHPGLDSLPCYKVKVDDGGLVRVRADRKLLGLNRRTKEMCAHDSSNPNTVVIVGGGPAGATCAETLRQENFTGNIVMVCREHVVPYDRVKVSKALDFDVELSVLRPLSFYKNHGIEVKLGTVATGLNTDEKVIQLSHHEKLHYNYLFICTGSKPRMPDLPGINLGNIFTLRDYTDAHSILSQLSPEKHIVILGLGFIGMEAAAYCVNKSASVTVIGKGAAPLQSVFGAEIGNRVRQEFEEKGVKFLFGNNIAQFVAKEAHPNSVGTVVLTDGTVLTADVAIIGIGSTLYTDWIKDSPIEMLEDGSIKVDKYLKTNVENVYAGGDIAYAPLFGSDSISAAVGHYPLAHYHGKIAALNICDRNAPLNTIPFFWTTLFGRSYRYAGHGKPDKIKIYGSLEKFEFFAYYLKDGKVIAMSSVGADPVVSDFANYLYEGKSLTEIMINHSPFGWIRNKPKDLVVRFQNEITTNQ
ncbi:apoptosis-inducing factor 3 isoform X2 [Lasioglossum baleicum]|uniref:apoptosis-inducing factor 3 isoform X2 n=1 Tax=Lasioglossum baleicum TaxID=434251 RepID=UPI003FCEBE27